MPEVQLPEAATTTATADLRHQHSRCRRGKADTEGEACVCQCCRLPALLVKGFQLPRTTLAFNCTARNLHAIVELSLETQKI